MFRCLGMLLVLVCVRTTAISAPDQFIHIRHFIEVNQHLYRGGQPDSNGVRELAAAHVAMILDLREPSHLTEAEKRLAEGLGMKYLNVPFREFGSPTPDQMKRVLSLLVPDDAGGPIFVHCRRGKDRTGSVVACYRIQHDGWTPQEALSEARKLGLSRAEPGMRSFILRFHPMELSPPAAGSK